METILNILISDGFVLGATAVMIFLITQILKLPIKHFTNKIKNERTRKIVNALILLIPFALGIAFEFALNALFLYLYSNPNTASYIETIREVQKRDCDFNWIRGLGYGTAGISIYGIIERFFKVKIQNPYTETEEGKAVTEFVDNITEDKKIDSNDKSAVQEFLDKVGK